LEIPGIMQMKYFPTRTQWNVYSLFMIHRHLIPIPSKPSKIELFLLLPRNTVQLGYNGILRNLTNLLFIILYLLHVSIQLGHYQAVFNIELCLTWIRISNKKEKQTNSVVSVRKRTIPTEWPPLVGEVSANFSE
jgi:hypothetical protein